MPGSGFWRYGAKATGLAPARDGFQKLDPSRNTGSSSCSNPAVSQCERSSAARKIEPGTYSGFSREGAVGERTGGTSPLAVLSGFAAVSAPTSTTDDSPTSFIAASSPPPPNPISTPPDPTHALIFWMPSSGMKSTL